MSTAPAFDLTLPPAEADHLRQCYAGAGVILEYGSGGSTLLAAQMQGKLVISVESDRSWAQRLQARIDSLSAPSAVVVWHVDIGPTGAWGRPRGAGSWERFHHYPLAIWDQPFFRHPDVVLVDGRFRAACLLTVALRIRHPVTVLFDDYVDRPAYHAVETLLPAPRIIGRLAEFYLQPDLIPAAAFAKVLPFFAQATYAGQDQPRYGPP